MKISILILLCLFLCGCETNDQERANNTVNQIIYIKDPRTDLCFAYVWKGGGYGGPGLACVPCDKIPKNMLIISEK